MVYNISDFFMSIEKIKTGGALMAKYHHNYRLVEVENADA